MAPAGGKSRCGYIHLMFICVVLQLVTFTTCFQLQKEEITLKVSHDTEVGTLILKSAFNSSCTEYSHIQRIPSESPTLFVIQNDERVVVSSPLQQYIGDLFILKPRPIPSCINVEESVSKKHHVNIQIAHSDRIMTFQKRAYFGTINRNAPPRTKIKGIDSLYACSPERCSSNIDYRVVGSSYFYLETVNNRGQIDLQIYSRESLRESLESVHNFIITAQNVDGLTGHTNIEIKVTEDNPAVALYGLKDETLHYMPALPKANRRIRRETQETRSVQQVEETATGTLFTVTDTSATVSVNYTLLSSTLQNTFIVSSDGDVTLAPGAVWDFEYFVTQNIPRVIQLTIEVKQISDGIVRMEIIQPVEITDVNDEDPVFTNKPFPFLATVPVQAASDMLVYTLTAMDPDAGASLSLEGQFTTDPAAAALFSVTIIQGNKAEIRTKISGDFARSEDYRVEVKATDTAASPTQQTIANVLIRAGDRAPQFMESPISVSFREVNGANQEIARGIEVVSFQDNPVTFDVLIDGSESTLFLAQQSDDQSGNIKGCNLIVTQTMDYEEDPTVYQGFIRAREGSNGVTLTSSVPLTITLLDWNEFTPRFTVSTYQTASPVKENIPIGSPAIKVTANDGDRNSKIRFTVDDGHFRVESTNPDSTNNPHEATIYVAKNLDYDTRPVKMYDFSVYATDDGTSPSPLTGQATVRITLEDVNDEPPVFPLRLEANLRYDKPVNGDVLLVRATDADAGDTVSYQFKGGPNVYPKFALDATTGRITVKQKIADNQESITDFIYLLEIIATDDGNCCGGTTQLSSTGTVTVNILTDNENQPAFPSCNNYEFSVNEEVADQLVAQVVAVDQDYGINGQVRYSIRETNSKFRINATSGELYTRVKIDREKNPRETVNVIATDGGNLTGLCPLIIKISDINDNEPTFVPSSYNVRVLNTLGVDFTAATVVAKDNDIGINSDIEFELLENLGGYFKFDTVGKKTGDIKVNRTLPTDRNDQPIQLLVQAKDKGTPSLHANATVTITLVENESQLPPIFVGGDYTITVLENQTIGTNLILLQARSQASNSKVLSFGIVDVTLDGTAGGSRNIFQTEDADSTNNGDIQNANLQLTGFLDYYTTKQYTVTVRATDLSPNPLSTDKRVTIIVEDVNNKKPYFPGQNEDTFFVELSLLEGDYSQSADPGKAVGQIIAKDDDGPPLNNKIERYRLVDAPDFTINPTTGWIYTKAIFDRETLAQRNFRVEAVDGAPSSINPPNHNTGTTLVLVTIEDVNDNPPYFMSNFTFDVDEDATIGFVAGQTGAQDPDSAAILQYSIPANLPFSIQPETADIKVAGQLDYDLGQKVYKFTVTVDDSLHSTTASVTINIKNVNDNPPVVQSYLVDDKTENDQSLVGQVLVKVNVTDVDNNAGPFYYALKCTDTIDQQYFDINQRGEVIIVKALDRDYPDGKAQFRCIVEVGDDDPDSGMSLYGYGILTVRPIDVNDNDPFFPPENLNMLVMENKQIGTLVDRVIAEDYDDENTGNGRLTIEINPVSPEFGLGNDNYIETKVMLDRESIDRYEVRVIATDHGPIPRTGTGTLTILVGDENDNAPVFNTTYKVKLSESQKSGEVIRATASDADTGKNARLTYWLDPKDVTYFKMDQDNNQGVLKIYREVDYDDLVNLQRSFNLTVYVQDIDINHRDTTYIEIEVTDYNDETPIFDTPMQSQDVPENAPENFFVAHFQATDRDVDPAYGSFEYYISRKSDPLRQFKINSTGHVMVQNSLDREAQERHIVHILAIDNVNGDIQNTGTATLTVTLIDVNDNFPNFANTYTPSIKEKETYVNTEVQTISATDADKVENGPPFSFKLQCTDSKASSFCSRFTLTEDRNGDFQKGTATIKVTGTFDRENDAGEKVISLPIYMCDLYNMGRPDQQCGIRYLYVRIRDENDNTHSDAKQYIQVYNYKGLFGPIKIGTVTVNDQDDQTSDNDKLFTLQGNVAQYYVSVTADRGEITLLENVPELIFDVKVLVADVNRPLVTATTTITIDVVFIPDDAVFNSGSVRIKGITKEDFLTKPQVGNTANFGRSMYDKTREQLARALYGSTTPSQLAKVQILSVMGSPPDPSGNIHTDVRFAAHGSPYYQSSRMDGIVASNMTVVSQSSRVDGIVASNMTVFNSLLTTNGVMNEGQIDMVPIDMCQFETCEGGCFNELVVSDTNPELIDTKGASYVGVKTEVLGSCGCRAKEFPEEIQCTPGYCYHGGQCGQDEFGVISCTCPAGFDGPRCQQLRQSFDGTGFALYRQLEQCEESRTSIEILTTTANALVLYNGPTADLTPRDPRDFIVLELVNGYARLRINHGTGEVAIEIPGSGKKRLNDNTWHRIDIIRKRKFVRLMIDNCADITATNGVEDRSNCEGSGYTKGENIYVNVPDVLQLGGRMTSPNYPPNVSNQKFTGCMKNLKHNAQLYDLSTGGQFPGARDGCEAEDNKCGPSGCENGKCLTTGPGPDQWICDCNPGYRTSTGKMCTTETTKRHLKTESYMNWKLKPAFKALLSSMVMKVGFHFRSRDTDGVIFSVTDQFNSNKHITLMIVNSYIRVSYNLGNGPYSLVLSHVKASDGQWHKIEVERYGKDFILKMDGGEGRYYVDNIYIPGPVDAAVEFSIKEDQINAGANLNYGGSQPTYDKDDLSDSCLNDVRMDDGWFAMVFQENTTTPAATLEYVDNTDVGCTKDDCTNKCPDGFICVPLWGTFNCTCPEHYVKVSDTCMPIDYCTPNPCFRPAVTRCLNISSAENPFTCNCIGGFYGPLCQCHLDLNSGSEVCNTEGEQEESVGVASGLIIGIVLGVLFLIVAIIIIAWLLMRRRSAPGKGELLDDDDMDDIRENVMYYDEEGAGEEDQTQYDLSRLRKPDTGEHPGTWDSPDLPETTKPLGKMSDRPDIGDFINGRLDDADDDPNSPPLDTPQRFDFEGGNSDAGSLSSLNTSSSGDQDYDYLGEWGPKFKKLADMYNNYDDTE